MPISTLAKISFPLDIPQVDVLATQQTRDGKFIITVESRRDTTRCGVCKQEIACKYGHGQIVRLRHLPILGQETYIELRQELPEATYKEVCYGMHWVLRHNHANLDDDDKVRLRRLKRSQGILMDSNEWTVYFAVCGLT